MIQNNILYYRKIISDDYFIYQLFSVLTTKSTNSEETIYLIFVLNLHLHTLGKVNAVCI